MKEVLKFIFGLGVMALLPIWLCGFLVGVFVWNGIMRPSFGTVLLIHEFGDQMWGEVKKSWARRKKKRGGT